MVLPHGCFPNFDLAFQRKKGRLIETAQPSCCVGGYVTCIGVEGGGALSTLSFCILFYSLIISDHENSNNRCCTQFSKTALLDAHHKGSIEQGCFYALQKTSYCKLNFRFTDAARGRGSPASGPDSRTGCRCSRRYGGRHSSCSGRCCRTAGTSRPACRPCLP